MRPLIWTSRAAALGAAIPFVALLMVELRSSRTADRSADERDRVIDVTTSRLFDVAATASLFTGVAASVGAPGSTIHRRLEIFAAGVSAMIAALALSASARAELGRFHRNALTVHVDQRIVDSGPYRITRHPLYAATCLAFVGIGAVLGNWISLAASVLPIGALVHRIRVEEAMLRDHLGDTYRTYEDKTWRLMPGIW
jgi:protein-S-isoprenylcysteine O-methyltransferase Ste14